MNTRLKQEILEKVARGELDAAQASEMLRAIERRSRERVRSVLDPVERMSEAQVLGTGIAVAATGVALSWFGVRFDGALDVHLQPDPVRPTIALRDALVAWPLTAVVLWTAARVRAPQTRFVDVLGAIGVARVPLLVMATVLVLFRDQIPTDPGEVLKPAFLAILFLLVLPCNAWNLTWLYRGFRTASGLRGRALVLTFVAALGVAEFVSKLLLF